MTPMDTVSGLLAFAQRQLDRLISPQARCRIFDRVQAFAAARPLSFTFIVAQVLTSLLPIGLFLAFTISVLAVSMGAALLFSLFWLGVALLFLIPALFMTVSLGLLVFMWAVAARFAWYALPARIKASITAAGGAPRSSEEHQHKGRQNGYREAHYPSYAAAAAVGAAKDAGSGQAEDHKIPPARKTVIDAAPPPPKLETNGSSLPPEAVGVADLEKFKEMKEGLITP
ncbi:hypothetical protein MAPG_09985 [Magnaporthiopsis poae ATCC 64411]|uniref:Uncharacterized protein n=1 Tax=Magnaporthiopsis poae (strain ATCC 64411 / 73-15) TaxID=644358 RepID=A0A0C4EBD7_MAGP6|nr:hypothetical protein MAPG_09985 [Magnaporthiopsis poae ATCC 64411]